MNGLRNPKKRIGYKQHLTVYYLEEPQFWFKDAERGCLAASVS